MNRKKVKNIAVFCGSEIGNNLVYRAAAEELANAFIKANINLIYGGAKIGLMGVLANSILQQGGTVVGVIPQALVDIEVAHDNLTKLHIVQTMHERKTLMSELADGFILLPGGAGSLEEFFEIITWQKLGLHSKPCGIINSGNYYDHLLNFLDHSVNEGFFHSHCRNEIFTADSPAMLLQKICG